LLKRLTDTGTSTVLAELMSTGPQATRLAARMVKVLRERTVTRTLSLQPLLPLVTLSVYVALAVGVMVVRMDVLPVLQSNPGRGVPKLLLSAMSVRLLPVFTVVSLLRILARTILTNTLSVAEQLPVVTVQRYRPLFVTEIVREVAPVFQL
jgi:hypothetical protein